MKLSYTYILLIMINLSIFGQNGNLIWEDNFNNGQLDLTKWSYETGTGVNGDWGTGQIDRATSREENVSFLDNIPGAEDGCLVITTRKEFYIDRNYTSGRINTAGKASWGPGHRIVAKVRPADVRFQGQGFAFWMMPDEIPDGWDYIMWPQGGEIDIMEYVGSIPYHNLGSVHYAWFWENNQWQSWNHGHQGAYYGFKTEEVPDPPEPGYGGYPPPQNAQFAGSSDFHLYGIDWYENRMEFFSDSSVYHIHYFNDGGAFQPDGQDEFSISEISGNRVALSEYSHHFPEWYPFDHNMFVILSAGVGGSQYTYGGAIVPEAEFPCAVYIDWVKVYSLGTTGLNEENHLPMTFQLNQNYPNPFNPSTVISYSIPEVSHVSVSISNSLGELSAILVDKLQFPGSYEVTFDASGLSSGLYFYTMRAGKFVSVKKMLLVK